MAGELVPHCSPLSFDEALTRIVAESPELAAARAKLAVDQATIDRELVEWVPDIVVRGGTGYNFEAKETTAVAGISVEIPFDDRNQGTVRQAQADYSRQRRDVPSVAASSSNHLIVQFLSSNPNRKKPADHSLSNRQEVNRRARRLHAFPVAISKPHLHLQLLVAAKDDRNDEQRH